MWDLKTGKELRRFEGHPSFVYHAAFSPDGRRALSGGEDGTVRLWDLQTGKELHRYIGHTGYVMVVSFTAGGRRVLSASCDRTVRLWAVAK